MNKYSEFLLIFTGLLLSHLATAWSGAGVVELSDVSPAQYAFAISTSLGASITKFTIRCKSEKSI